MLAASAIEQSVAESRRRLRVDSLPLVLFHREADAVHLCVLERLAERGWLGRAGVSCDHQPTSAACWIGAGAVSAVQLPASLLDRRHRDAGVFRRASARGIAVFVRSVYLQGLLVMAEDSVPPPLREIIPPRRKFEDIARQGGMTLAELALRYLLSQPEVTAIVVGVETAAQARANLALVGRGPLDSATLAAIDATRPAVPDWLITPSAWPGR
jgi:aryl-alcohol dehydrogenase-like predicted oxidoreductase